MKKQPLFDVSRFNHLADKYNIPWIDRIPLIETVCWGSKGWIDSELARKMVGQYAPLMRKLGVKVSGGYVYVIGNPNPARRIVSPSFILIALCSVARASE